MNFSRPPSLILLVYLLLQSCAHSTSPKPNPYRLDLPGPTLASRVAGGYELKNRHVRVVIDDKSGDVVFWGPADGSRNVLASQPLEIAIRQSIAASTEPSTPLAATLPAVFEISTSTGYIEARDDQTWQYLGEDPQHQIVWRKIYCLDGDHLNVSMLAQNRRNVPVTIQLALKCDFSAMPRKRWDSSEVFEAAGNDAAGAKAASAEAVEHLQAYNEFHGIDAQPPYLLLSDIHTLKPDERISWTMQWILR